MNLQNASDRKSPAGKNVSDAGLVLKSRPLVRQVHRRGFTLIECLATILLMAIVLPVVSQGLSATTNTASKARLRTEAAGLAQSKLSELIAGGSAVWSQGSLAGDFGADWPVFQWKAQLSNWTGGASNISSTVTMQQLDVIVTWTARGQPESVTVSGLVYTRPIPTS